MMYPTRRQLIQGSLTSAAAIGAGAALGQTTPAKANRIAPKRIATEEAFSTPEIFAATLELLAKSPEAEPAFAAFWKDSMGTAGAFTTQLVNLMGGKSTASLMDFISATAAAHGRNGPEVTLARLAGFGAERLKIMDAAGISMQLLSLTAPGGQIFEPELGTALARQANDRLAEVVRANPPLCRTRGGRPSGTARSHKRGRASGANA
jgi:hypothetical protein